MSVGSTTASLKLIGTVALSKERLTMSAITGSKSLKKCFIKEPGIGSRIEDFEDIFFTSDESSLTDVGENSRSSGHLILALTSGKDETTIP